MVGIFIKDVVPGGVADIEGTLRPGKDPIELLDSQVQYH